MNGLIDLLLDNRDLIMVMKLNTSLTLIGRKLVRERERDLVVFFSVGGKMGGTVTKGEIRRMPVDKLRVCQWRRKLELLHNALLEILLFEKDHNL